MQDEDQQTENNNTEYRKDLQHGSHQTNEDEPSCSERVSRTCFLLDTRRVTYRVKCSKSLVGDIEKK